MKGREIDRKKKERKKERKKRATIAKESELVQSERFASPPANRPLHRSLLFLFPTRGLLPTATPLRAHEF